MRETPVVESSVPELAQGPSSLTHSSLQAATPGRPQDPSLPPAERAEKEYADVSQNMRHYGNMRFAQLTLFSAITAGFVKIATEVGAKWSTLAQALLYASGILVTACFWVMEERAADYWHHYRRRAEVLESYLSLAQYVGKKRKRITATNAVRVLFVLALFAWSAVLIMLLSNIRA